MISEIDIYFTPEMDDLIEALTTNVNQFCHQFFEIEPDPLIESIIETMRNKGLNHKFVFHYLKDFPMNAYVGLLDLQSIPIKVLWDYLFLKIVENNSGLSYIAETYLQIDRDFLTFAFILEDRMHMDETSLYSEMKMQFVTANKETYIISNRFREILQQHSEESH